MTYLNCPPRCLPAPEAPDFEPTPVAGQSCDAPVFVRQCEGDEPLLRRIIPGGVNLGNIPGFDPDGYGGTFTITPFVGTRLQAFGVTVLRSGPDFSTDYVRVTLPTGTNVYMVQGMTQTWSVAQDNGLRAEFMLPGEVTVTCFGQSACSVFWTEE